MLRPGPGVKAYLYMAPVDMRKSIDGLAALVEQEMDLSPYDAVLFVFCNRAKDKIKMLCWERNGFIVWYKRLEKERFKWSSTEGQLNITGRELNWLLDGIDIWRTKPHKTLHFDSVS